MGFVIILLSAIAAMFMPVYSTTGSEGATQIWNDALQIEELILLYSKYLYEKVSIYIKIRKKIIFYWCSVFGGSLSH
jgi:hypothetical protein